MSDNGMSIVDVGSDLSQTTATHLTLVGSDQSMQQHSNIILIRGARTENGQIILQNSQELLNLLNSSGGSIIASDDDKPIILQQPRYKQTKTITNDNTSARILIQSPIKASTSTTSTSVSTLATASSSLTNHIVDANTINSITTTVANNSVFLQTPATIKKCPNPTITNATNVSTNIPDGSIILQQRLNKNSTTDGPILLQTLKRIDKSQSILLFRNAQNVNATISTNPTSKTTTITNTTTSSHHVNNVLTNGKDDTKISALSTKIISSNIPLGNGKYQPK